MTTDRSAIFGTSVASATYKIVTGTIPTYVGSSDLALTASGGILTYSGSNGRTALVFLTLWVSPNTGSTTLDFNAGISLNGDLTGATQTGNTATSLGAVAGFFTSLNTVRGINLTCQRRVTLNNGDTLQAVGARSLNDIDIDIRSYEMTVLFLN